MDLLFLADAAFLLFVVVALLIPPESWPKSPTVRDAGLWPKLLMRHWHEIWWLRWGAVGLLVAFLGGLLYLRGRKPAPAQLGSHPRRFGMPCVAWTRSSLLLLAGSSVFWVAALAYLFPEAAWPNRYQLVTWIAVPVVAVLGVWAVVARIRAGKGDRSNSCRAPSGPFRQIGPVPVSTSGEAIWLDLPLLGAVAALFVIATLLLWFSPTAWGWCLWLLDVRILPPWKALGLGLFVAVSLLFVRHWSKSGLGIGD